MKKINHAFVLSILVLLYCVSFGVAQGTAPIPELGGGPKKANEVFSLKHNSVLMKREMPFRVVLPARYRIDTKKKYPTIYLLHGLFGNYKNWSDRTKLAEYSTEHEFIIVMPNGGNGWYTDSATKSDDRYESYIVEELMPEIDRMYRTNPTREGRAIAGLSMGGYGALKFGLKYPDKFVLAGSFSGALRITDTTKEQMAGRKVLLSSVIGTFGPFGSQTRKKNDVFAILNDMNKAASAKLPFLYFDCGTEDFLIGQNRELAALLFKKKVPHEFRQLPGRHNWKFWDQQVEEFLDLAERFVE